MKYVPAIQEEYLLADWERTAFLEYLLLKTPGNSITVTLDEINKTRKDNGPYHLRRDYSPDYTSITFSAIKPDWEPEYEGLMWVGIPEDLVPHG